MVYVVVDPQNDFITGKLGSERAKTVADKIASFIENVDPDEGMITVTTDYHYKDDPEFEKFGKHCLVNTKGAEIYNPIQKALDNFEGDKEIVSKDTFGVELELEGEEVTLMGFCTDICVLVNAVLILQEYPYMKVYVDSNLSCGTTEEKEKAALSVLEGLGVNII